MVSKRVKDSRLTSLGRPLFAAATLAFGVQHILYGRLRPGLLPLPVWLHHGHVLAYAMGAFLIVVSVLLLAARNVRDASFALGAVLLAASLLHLTHAHAVFTNGNARTGFLEPLSLAAAALVLGGLASRGGVQSLTMLGRVLFGLAMIVFGVQHFQYTAFITQLVPAWIRYPHFWVVFTGLVLILAGLGILTGIAAKLSALGLAAMFFVWLVTLHIPLVVAQPRNGDLWSSAFVVLALWGACLFLAAAPAPAIAQMRR